MAKAYPRARRSLLPCRLRRVAGPRSVRQSESFDFTPWLAENIDVLADELGMSLTVIATEVYIGQFKLDIHAEDDEGDVVVIENQLERTDHSHLGQSIVYAAGLEASTVIWVSRQRSGVSGRLAPNDWQKDVKARTPASGDTTPSFADETRQDIFAVNALERVNAARPAVRVPARNRGSWISFASGPFGGWSMCQVNDGRLRVEAYLDCGDGDRNTGLFDELEDQADRWGEAVGRELTFERLEKRRASRIAVYHSAVDLTSDLSDAKIPTWCGGQPARSRVTW